MADLSVKKWRRFLGLTVLGLATFGLIVRLMMPVTARVLIRSDTLAPADAIIVLGSGRLERTFEAATLFHEGWSGQILLMRTPDVANSGLLKQMNVRIPVLMDVQRDILAQMGVPAAAVRESSVLGNTRAEAEFTTNYARRMGFKRIIVVTSPYHTARAGRLFREAAGNSLEIILRANRYETIDPDRWWRHPIDRHDVVLEYLKSIYGLVPESLIGVMK